jgi:hypothetical protein
MRGSQWRQRRAERMRASRDKLKSARAQNKTESKAHGRTMHVCGLKNPRMCGTRPRMKIRMDFSQFCFELDDWQVGLGRLVHLQVKQTKRREK